MIGKSSRLFFALWPDSLVREAIIDARADGMPDTDRHIRAGNLHLTVQFLGNVDDRVRGDLIDIAEKIAIPRFLLRLDTSGWWKAVKVAWLAPSRIPPELQQLHDTLHQIARLQGLQVDERTYHPHVTLARKTGMPVALEFEPILWNVMDFCLAESIPQTGYVEYKIIRHWTLT